MDKDEQMSRIREAYFEDKAYDNLELWEEMKGSPEFSKFTSMLDEEQRERVDKYFERAILVFVLTVEKIEGLNSTRWRLGFKYPMEEGKFRMAAFAFFVRIVLNPRGDKSIPYQELCELFPELYDWGNQWEHKSTTASELCFRVKERVDTAFDFDHVGEADAGEIINLVFFDVKLRLLIVD